MEVGRRQPSRLAVRVFSLLVGILALSMYGEDRGYSDKWGPAVGSQLPTLTVLDPKGDSPDLESLKGKNGLVLVFVRSSDW